MSAQEDPATTGTAGATTARGTPDVSPDRGAEGAGLPRTVRRSWRRFQVIAHVVGVWLLLLCVAMVAKYGFRNDGPMRVIGPVHGFGYMVYLVLAFDLTRQLGWSLRRTLGVLLAGTVPFLSFVAERAVSRAVKRRG